VIPRTDGSSRINVRWKWHDMRTFRKSGCPGIGNFWQVQCLCINFLPRRAAMHRGFFPFIPPWSTTALRTTLHLRRQSSNPWFVHIDKAFPPRRNEATNVPWNLVKQYAFKWRPISTMLVPSRQCCIQLALYCQTNCNYHLQIASKINTISLLYYYHLLFTTLADTASSSICNDYHYPLSIATATECE
jgi:hypothetical protein